MPTALLTTWRNHTPTGCSLLDRRLAAIESHPFIGNPNVRPSLTERFGPTLRAFPVPPFTIVYRYDDERDRLEFLALPYDRSVW